MMCLFLWMKGKNQHSKALVLAVWSSGGSMRHHWPDRRIK